MPTTKFASQLEASSYQHPNGGGPYALLRQHAVETATAMGYDPATMCERGIVWSDDQDPFDHVANSAYPHFVAICNFRVFESFEEYLGDKYQDLLKGRGIGVMVKTYTLDIKRPVTYPDSVCNCHMPRCTSRAYHHSYANILTFLVSSSSLQIVSQKSYLTATTGSRLSGH